MKHRGTKIVCTLGRHTKEKDAMKEMLLKGMNIVRLNMNYFSVPEMTEIVEDINRASQESNIPCATMVDLKGPIIRILPFRD